MHLSGAVWNRNSHFHAHLLDVGEILRKPRGEVSLDVMMCHTCELAAVLLLLVGARAGGLPYA